MNITWGNATDLHTTNVLGTGTLIVSQTVTLNPGGSVSFDVSSYLAAHIGEVITLQIISETASTGLFILNSREAATGKPTLSLTFTAPVVYGSSAVQT